jgi:tRNA modification GTPase
VSTSTPARQGTYQLLTGPGPAAIAVIRVCGPAVGEFATAHIRTSQPIPRQLWSAGRVRRAELVDSDGTPLDDMLITAHAPPPEWDLRLYLHGSPWVYRRCIELLTQLGFTERREETTTLWRTADTIEAEGHALLPRMLTLRGAHWLMRQIVVLRETLTRWCESPFSHPGAEALQSAQRESRVIAARAEMFEWFARPLRVALVGPPNSGKSTLANALADQPVSLVSPAPGTTRDWVEIPAEARGFPVTWLDTAGLRTGGDELEAQGVARSRRIIDQADAVLVVLDATPEAAPARAQFLREYANLEPTCVALNKCDLVDAPDAIRETLSPGWQARVVAISAAHRTGLEMLLKRLVVGAGRDERKLDAPAAFTARQVAHLEAARRAPDRDRFREHIRHCLHEPTGP